MREMRVSQIMGLKDRSNNDNDAACDKKRKELKVKGQYDICMVTKDTAPTAAPSPTSILLHFQIYDTNQHVRSTVYISLLQSIRDDQSLVGLACIFWGVLNGWAERHRRGIRTQP